MTDRINDAKSNSAKGKKDWRKPQVRAVVPVKNTRGGYINGVVENTFYIVS